MNQYPSIPKEVQKGLSIYSFNKIDGSQIRSEYTRKTGFSKFGSRGRLLGSDQEFISEGKDLFLNKYARDLIERFKQNNIEKAVVFSEFFGEHSFVGTHQAEPHDVVIFDIHIYKRGLLPPKEYLELMEGLEIAPLLYHGPCSAEFIESVRNSTLEGMGLEGVVCKAKNPKNAGLPIMFKIKSQAWLDRLKLDCGDDTKKFELLA